MWEVDSAGVDSVGVDFTGVDLVGGHAVEYAKAPTLPFVANPRRYFEENKPPNSVVKLK